MIHLAMTTGDQQEDKVRAQEETGLDLVHQTQNSKRRREVAKDRSIPEMCLTQKMMMTTTLLEREGHQKRQEESNLTP